MKAQTKLTTGPRQAATCRTPSSASTGEGPAQDAWSAFCESHGTRCSVVKGGVRCEGGVEGETGRCLAHQSDESIAAVRKAVADEIISELTYLRPDVVDGYKAAEDPSSRDFVFVEEGVSAALEALDLGIEHVQTCGLVFGWLKSEHGVEAPAWWFTRRIDESVTGGDR